MVMPMMQSLLIRLWKPPGIEDANTDLPQDSFFLCIVTELQVELLKVFSKNIVFLDVIRCINQYKYKLITLVDADEFHNGKMYYNNMYAKSTMNSILKCPIS